MYFPAWAWGDNVEFGGNRFKRILDLPFCYQHIFTVEFKAFAFEYIMRFRKGEPHAGTAKYIAGKLMYASLLFLGYRL